MTPYEIVKALRENAEWCDANEYDVPLCMGDNQRAAADLIESQQARIAELEAQLAVSQHREQAAVEDLKALSESNGDCSMCLHFQKNDSEYFPDCDTCPCDNGLNKWQWRGPQEAGKGETE